MEHMILLFIFKWLAMLILWLSYVIAINDYISVPFRKIVFFNDSSLESTFREACQNVKGPYTPPCVDVAVIMPFQAAFVWLTFFALLVLLGSIVFGEFGKDGYNMSQKMMDIAFVGFSALLLFIGCALMSYSYDKMETTCYDWNTNPAFKTPTEATNATMSSGSGNENETTTTMSTMMTTTLSTTELTTTTVPPTTTAPGGRQISALPTTESNSNFKTTKTRNTTSVPFQVLESLDDDVKFNPNSTFIPCNREFYRLKYKLIIAIMGFFGVIFEFIILLMIIMAPKPQLDQSYSYFAPKKSRSEDDIIDENHDRRRESSGPDITDSLPETHVAGRQ